MEDRYENDAICLQVFARVSAAVSHEIKNTLSIINENAGLLDDLAAMSEENEGVSRTRVQAAAATIMKQVDRSNTIMKNLNRFAHSGDTPVSGADLQETLSLMVALSARQAAMNKVSVVLVCPAQITLNTYLFAFESLLYLLLCDIYSHHDSGCALEIHAGGAPPEITIEFKTEPRGGVLSKPPGDEMQRVLADKVQCRYKTVEDGLVITMPATIKPAASS